MFENNFLFYWCWWQYQYNIKVLHYRIIKHHAGNMCICSLIIFQWKIYTSIIHTSLHILDSSYFCSCLHTNKYFFLNEILDNKHKKKNPSFSQRWKLISCRTFITIRYWERQQILTHYCTIPQFLPDTFFVWNATACLSTHTNSIFSHPWTIPTRITIKYATCHNTIGRKEKSKNENLAPM